MRTGDGDIVNERAMQFNIVRTIWRHLFELFNGANRMSVTAFTFPDIKWGSPITVTGNSPILNIFQPVTKTAFSNAFRHPVDSIVVTNQIVFDFCHSDEPGFSCIIDQRGSTTPAVWIAVLKFRCRKEQSACVQIFQNFWVGIFTEGTCPICLSGHFTFGVNQLDEW